MKRKNPFGEWQPRQLKKIEKALTEPDLKRRIEEQEGRNWKAISPIQPYKTGYGVLMELQIREDLPQI